MVRTASRDRLVSRPTMGVSSPVASRRNHIASLRVCGGASGPAAGLPCVSGRQPDARRLR
jgi:hypothetical protein